MPISPHPVPTSDRLASWAVFEPGLGRTAGEGTAMVDVPTHAPSETCDVIMKGGITSAVVYPRGLAEFAKTYRLRGLGGTSAGAVGAIGWLLYRTVTDALPENNFGICKGLGAGPSQPGFTDWLSDQIQVLAGRRGGVPLTFGDLRGRDIDLRMMTTCINLGRPYE